MNWQSQHKYSSYIQLQYSGQKEIKFIQDCAVALTCFAKVASVNVHIGDKKTNIIVYYKYYGLKT